MLVVVSPAKRLDWAERPMKASTPEFLGDANRLAGHARALTHLFIDIQRMSKRRGTE